MKISITQILCIASLALTISATETQTKPELLATSPAVSTVSAIPTGPIPAGPEARQASPSLSSSGGPPVYPYNLNSLYASSSSFDPSSPPSPSGSSSSSIMSFLRSPQGGRRSSLTSRLRNLMNSIFFRRETGSPYMTSASSNFYSYRQPPPFGFSSLGSSSGLPSGYGSSPNFLTAAASGYRPVVFPNYPGSSSSGSGPSGPSSWSNYKQWSGPGASSGPSASSGLTSSSLGSPGGTNYAWSTGSGSGPSSSPYSSGLVGSYNSSPSGASPQSSYGSSSSSIQASASNTYPSSAPSSSSYGSSVSSYPVSGSPYQRSSVSTNFKPVPSSGPSSSSVSSSSTNQASNTYKN